MTSPLASEALAAPHMRERRSKRSTFASMSTLRENEPGYQDARRICKVRKAAREGQLRNDQGHAARFGKAQEAVRNLLQSGARNRKGDAWPVAGSGVASARSAQDRSAAERVVTPVGGRHPGEPVEGSA